MASGQTSIAMQKKSIVIDTIFFLHYLQTVYSKLNKFAARIKRKSNNQMELSNMDNQLKPTIEKLFNALNNKNDSEILGYYERTVLLLNNAYFVKSHWPDDKKFGKDKLSIILCKELRQRHAYTHISSLPNQDHKSAFENCRKFFDSIAKASKPVQLKLPDDWLWQIIDTFVSRYIEVNGRDDARNTFSDIYSKFLTHSSNIDSKSVASTLHYFSLVEMLRLHSLCGDYKKAINLLKSINIHKKDQNTPIPAFEVLTSYYAGFSYMMMSRYRNAIDTFTSILVTIHENKSLYIKRSYQNNQINELIEKMYRLMAICWAVSQTPVHGIILRSLHDRDYTNGFINMYNNDWNEFEGFFKSGRPEHIIDEASTDFKLQIEQHFNSHIFHHSRPDAEFPDSPNSRNFTITETCSKTLQNIISKYIELFERIVRLIGLALSKLIQKIVPTKLRGFV
ncbi:eukaryotic translation initiation factor 3 subunit L-like isoform X2 [Contarinia nasturtii]|uniref:eukaryotic translation initiation factor 3 subunit L-like isoform X2 n=1 Tax=Contarinia nasturtii TaxID=265458 RepID=UPI0012D3ECE3|nr:eukaryotic translation initiation factor 3 subunit L-like isoform X2 [Contarinia nasturtii]